LLLVGGRDTLTLFSCVLC